MGKTAIFVCAAAIFLLSGCGVQQQSGLNGFLPPALTPTPQRPISAAQNPGIQAAPPRSENPAAATAAAAIRPRPQILLDTGVGQYLTKDGRYSYPVPDRLVIATASDVTNKGAGFGFHISDLDRDKPGQDLLLVFPDAATWRSFVQQWQKARQTKQTPGMSDVKIGDYFDGGREVLLTVAVNDEGIEFKAVGKDNGVLALTIFQLVPVQFERFDASVLAVSAYFDN